MSSRVILVPLFASLIASLPLAALEPSTTAIALQPLLRDLDHPVQVVAAHDHTGDLYIAEQAGVVLRLPYRQPAPQTFLDLRTIVDCCANGGLLSVVFHPDYPQNGWLFVLYVNRDGDTTLARYSRSSIDRNVADPASGRILLVADQPADNVPNHHGGTLQFGPDGMLYVSIGDGGAYVAVTNRAQEREHLLGKLLRIDVDHGEPYAIPPDNPYAGWSGWRGEIWSFGLRNPWRFSFDRQTGTLYLADVGQNDWEEVDITTLTEARGANFGWPFKEGTHCFPAAPGCDSLGSIAPLLEYGRPLGCSVTGGYRYRGTRWTRFRDVYFYGDYCSGRVWAARQDSRGLWSSSEVLKTGALIVSFGEDDDGELYLVDHAGSIYRITDPIPRRTIVRR